jgi:hypothetical protein
MARDERDARGRRRPVKTGQILSDDEFPTEAWAAGGRSKRSRCEAPTSDD